jgi:hypothetical protein
LIAEELQEFIKLWQLPREIILNQEEKDETLWKWTPNGDYTASPAYKVQFKGSHPPFQTAKLWNARAECNTLFFVKEYNSRNYLLK